MDQGGVAQNPVDNNNNDVVNVPDTTAAQDELDRLHQQTQALERYVIEQCNRIIDERDRLVEERNQAIAERDQERAEHNQTRQQRDYYRNQMPPRSRIGYSLRM